MSTFAPTQFTRNEVLKHMLAALFAIAAVAWSINVVGQYLIDVVALREWVSSFGPKAPLAFIVLFTLAHLVFLPLAPFTLVGLALFHWPIAVASIFLSHNIAANLGYMLPSLLGKERLERIWSRNPQLAELDKQVCRRGFAAVLAMRIVPALPFSLVSYIAALSCIRWRDYALASFVGFLPGSMIMALVLSHSTPG